jgi:hypothetical protein
VVKGAAEQDHVHRLRVVGEEVGLDGVQPRRPCVPDRLGSQVQRGHRVAETLQPHSQVPAAAPDLEEPERSWRKHLSEEAEGLVGGYVSGRQEHY